MGSCWFFARALSTAGYGVIWNGEKVVYAHRLMYEQMKGSVPKGLELDHLCRNRSCINPDHLEPVTHKENQARGLGAELFIRHNAYKKACQKGHIYDDKNTYYRKDRPGDRGCRACRTEATYRFNRRKQRV